LRILVAEDNAIAGKVIRALLEKQGCEVTLVSDGEQALSRALAEPFALALVDLRMPKLDGASFARAYRASEKEGRQLPIVALTASASEDARNRCLDAGMDNFLAKPVNPRELGKMVERYADLSRDTSSCRRRIEAQGTMSDGDERVDPPR
jgi:two-component system sensor histidine kinase RpfC